MDRVSSHRGIGCDWYFRLANTAARPVGALLRTDSDAKIKPTIAGKEDPFPLSAESFTNFTPMILH